MADAWQGWNYRVAARGYSGRSATWIGTKHRYNVMQAAFGYSAIGADRVDDEGMDSGR